MTAPAVCETEREMVFHQRGVSRRFVAVAVFAALTVVGCAETPRTATNFCRVLAERIDEIVAPPKTQQDVEQLVDHYSRLAEVAPLEVEADFLALREIFAAAADVNVNDPQSLQAVADASYAAEAAADRAAMYVATTCGVDLSTGLAVDRTP